MNETDKILARGLVDGYVGRLRAVPVWRGPFEGKHTLSMNGQYGEVYIDEWFAHLRGGGQELVQVGDKKATRLYAGGVIDTEELTKMGLTKKDVITKLKAFLAEAGEKTRLHEDCRPTPNGNWSYSYTVLGHVPEVDLTLGKEELCYRESLAFVHYFLVSPVE